MYTFPYFENKTNDKEIHPSTFWLSRIRICWPQASGGSHLGQSGGALIRGQFHLNWILLGWRSKVSELSRNFMNIVESWNVDWQGKRGLSHVACDSPIQREPKTACPLSCPHDAWLSPQPRGPHISEKHHFKLQMGIKPHSFTFSCKCSPVMNSEGHEATRTTCKRLEVISEPHKWMSSTENSVWNAPCFCDIPWSLSSLYIYCSFQVKAWNNKHEHQPI